jgi:rhodanese-related sulfurtransferase
MNRSHCSATLCVSLAGLALAAGVALGHTDLTAAEARAMILSGGAVVLDVREYNEFCGTAAHIDDAANLPWNSGVLAARFAELPADVDILVVCGSGGRSNQAANFLDGQGFTRVYDMLGGMGAWLWETEACDADPALALSKGGTVVEIDWSPTFGEQDYDLLRGRVVELADAVTHVDLGVTECLALGTVFTYGDDSDASDPGDAVFYLARQENGPWGAASSALDRLPATATCD